LLTKSRVSNTNKKIKRERGGEREREREKERGDE
jgi:hypothetical protein